MPFTAYHHGTDKLGLAALLEAFANDQWIGVHYTEGRAVAAVMDRFKRLVEAELEMEEVRAGAIDMRTSCAKTKGNRSASSSKMDATTTVVLVEAVTTTKRGIGSSKRAKLAKITK